MGVSPSAAGVGGRGHGVCVFLLERLSMTPWTTTAAAADHLNVTQYAYISHITFIDLVHHTVLHSKLNHISIESREIRSHFLQQGEELLVIESGYRTLSLTDAITNR